MTRVLVSTWGNPFQWQPITYEFKGETLKSRNTLPILLKVLKPEKVLIITLDTMANYVHKDGRPFPGKKLSSYEEIKDDVKERIMWHIENEVIKETECEELESMLKEGKIEIDVVPGVGIFGNISVYGEMFDFYHYVTYKLANWLPANQDLEVYLDLTHGINFMPTLTYRALRNLLGLLAFVKNVAFEVVNSEPYPLGVPENETSKVTLHIREIGEGKVPPRPIYSIVENDQWTAFISSIANGFPLVFARFYPNVGDVKRRLEEEYGQFLESIEVIPGEKPTIKRKEKFSRDFKNVSKLYYLLRVLNPKYSKYRRKELTINDIKEISGLFMRLPRVGAVLEVQIEDLERGVGRVLSNIRSATGGVYKELKSGKAYPLSEVSFFGKAEFRDDKKQLRNFIAHSGFEYNLTHVKYRKNTNEIYFFYKDVETVIKLSKEALRYHGEVNRYE